MPQWLVTTPEYGEVVPITDEGQGPIEYGCDWVVVDATTKRDAIRLAVKLMRADREFRYHRRWCDGNPYAGMKAQRQPKDNVRRIG